MRYSARRIRGWVVVLLVIGGAAPARAQITAPEEAAQIQLGPLSLYPGLQIVDAGRDQNVFNDGTAPREDYTFTVSSKVLAVLRLGLNELMVQTGNDYVWFQEFASERSSNASYAVRFNLSASRLKPFVGAERQRTRARRNPEIDARAGRLERAAIGGLGLELSPRTSLTASIRVEDSSYQDHEMFRGVRLDESLNRTGRIYNGGVRYAITPLTTVVVLGGFEDQIFPESHVRDLKRYTLTPVFEFSPEAAIRGRATAGVEVVEPDDPAIARHVGAIYELGLNWSVYGRTTFDVSGARNISYSYQDTEPYYLLTGVRLTVGQQVFGRLDAYGGFDWEHMAYRWKRDPVARTFDEQDRTDRLTSVTGGIAVPLGGGFSIRLGVEKTRRRSIEDPRQNFSRTRILSTVIVGS